MAALQKRRELKAAGINFELKRKKKKVMNYNVEVPFKRTVPDGRHDIEDEGNKDDSSFIKSNLAI